MTRFYADSLLLLVALIWGGAFVAQKLSVAHLGAFTFIAVRFAISGLLVLPLALREQRKKSPAGQPPVLQVMFLCAIFLAATALQQTGITHTSVTNAGFLTGLYVVFVPMICFLFYRQKIPRRIIPASLAALAGIALLSGNGLDFSSGFSYGDTLVLLCAAAFAMHVILIGRIMAIWKSPLTLSCIQYGFVALASGLVAFATETPDATHIMAAIWPILYAGVLSGGVAYTLQIVAQQYTPPSDAAIILSAEALFAGLFGWLMTGDTLTAAGFVGCTLITAAIVIVELWPYIAKSKSI